MLQLKPKMLKNLSFVSVYFILIHQTKGEVLMIHQREFLFKDDIMKIFMSQQIIIKRSCPSFSIGAR